jgi:membrane protease YdiL (CAAX protease family)
VSATSPRSRPAAWKVLLALLSLSLSLLLWLGGLIDSLQRPSVGGDLAIRQLELSLLAQPALPAPLQALLVGPDPQGALLKELDAQAQDGAAADQLTAKQQPTAIQPPTAKQQLQRALLLQLSNRTSQARVELKQLQARPQGSLPPGETALLQALLAGDAPSIQAAASEQSTPTLRLLACQLGSPGDQSCVDPSVARQAASQLTLVNGLPALALFLGLILLVRELWLLWRGRLVASPPLQGPDLSLVDLALLVAGGFVVIGNVTPLVVTPGLQAVLTTINLPESLRQGLAYPVLYLSMMVAPLGILVLMLRGAGPAPEGGWLQFRWSPSGSALLLGVRGLLMVLPLVSLIGWLMERILPSPSGSNPMLELVLHSHDGLALACFALTALVLAPLFEEVIFRGVLLPVLSRDLGTAVGLLLSSAVFALAHLSISETPALFVLGLGLARVRQRSGRLAASVIMHSLWNGFTFLNLILLGS